MQKKKATGTKTAAGSRSIKRSLDTGVERMLGVLKGARWGMGGNGSKPAPGDGKFKFHIPIQAPLCFTLKYGQEKTIAVVNSP